MIATYGAKTTRFDWSRRTLSETGWRLQEGYRSRIWALDEIKEISVKRYAGDFGINSFAIRLDFSSGESLGVIASYTSEDEARYLADDLRRACGVGITVSPWS